MNPVEAVAGDLLGPTLIRQLSHPKILTLHLSESSALGLGYLKSEGNRYLHGTFHPTTSGMLGTLYQLAIKNNKVFR